MSDRRKEDPAELSNRPIHEQGTRAVPPQGGSGTAPASSRSSVYSKVQEHLEYLKGNKASEADGLSAYLEDVPCLLAMVSELQEGMRDEINAAKAEIVRLQGSRSDEVNSLAATCKNQRNMINEASRSLVNTLGMHDMPFVAAVETLGSEFIKMRDQCRRLEHQLAEAVSERDSVNERYGEADRSAIRLKSALDRATSVMICGHPAVCIVPTASHVEGSGYCGACLKQDDAVRAAVTAETLACCAAVCEQCAANSHYNAQTEKHGHSMLIPCKAAAARKRLPGSQRVELAQDERDARLGWLHRATRAGLVLCQECLDETGGDIEKAKTLVKQRQAAK